MLNRMKLVRNRLLQLQLLLQNPLKQGSIQPEPFGMFLNLSFLNLMEQIVECGLKNAISTLNFARLMMSRR